MTSQLQFADCRVSFGGEAARFASRFPSHISLIASDEEHAVLAVAAAAELRRRGTLFYAVPILDDKRALLAQNASGPLLIHYRSIDERREAFDSLANEHGATRIIGQTANRFVGEPRIRLLRDLLIMSDAFLARSRVNAAMVTDVCGYRRRFSTVSPGTDAEVPAVHSKSRRSIVVWAPHLPAARLGIIAMALQTFKSDITFICASGSLPDIEGEFLGPEYGAASLENASCIVDASISDPATTMALAQIGVPVVAASTAGAGEFVCGICEYDPWSFRSVHAAISRARGTPPPIVTRPNLSTDEVSAVLAMSAPPNLRNGPLVSIILATYNRPAALATSLTCIEGQTYKDIEVIVVNDGGEDVRHVCADFPFVRLINLETNAGNPCALSNGMKHIHGSYFTFFADDDWCSPDHFSRVVYALESSGGSVAHAQTLMRYCEKRPDGSNRTRAYKMLLERPNDPIEMLTGPTIGLSSMLFRREVIDEIGFLDPNCSLVDVEYQMRASERYDFIALDAVTQQWNYNIEQTTYTHQIGLSRFLSDQEAIYEKYPSSLRCVAARRADWLSKIQQRYNDVLWPPDEYLPEDFTD